MHQIGCGKCVEFIRSINEAWRILDTIKAPLRLPDVMKAVDAAVIVLAGEHRRQKAQADAEGR